MVRFPSLQTIKSASSTKSRQRSKRELKAGKSSKFYTEHQRNAS